MCSKKKNRETRKSNTQNLGNRRSRAGESIHSDFSVKEDFTSTSYTMGNENQRIQRGRIGASGGKMKSVRSPDVFNCTKSCGKLVIDTWRGKKKYSKSTSEAQLHLKKMQ